jgi:hypothetical protein
MANRSSPWDLGTFIRQHIRSVVYGGTDGYVKKEARLSITPHLWWWIPLGKHLKNNFCWHNGNLPLESVELTEQDLVCLLDTLQSWFCEPDAITGRFSTCNRLQQHFTSGFNVCIFYSELLHKEIAVPRSHFSLVD